MKSKKCTCGGPLEKLASTGRKESNNIYEITLTSYYECEKCGELYESQCTKLAAYKPEPYQGRLRTGELIEYAPKLNGRITEHDEKGIVRRRISKW